MTAIKNFLSKKGAGYYLVLPAFLCALGALIMYKKTGITKFNPSLSGTAITCLWIAMGLLLVSLVIDFKPIRYLAYLVCLYGFFAYISSQITYIANILVGIDGSTFEAGFLTTAGLYFGAFVLMLLAGIFAKRKAKAEKEEG